MGLVEFSPTEASPVAGAAPTVTPVGGSRSARRNPLGRRGFPTWMISFVTMPLMIFVWYHFVYLPKQNEGREAVGRPEVEADRSEITGNRGARGRNAGGRYPRSNRGGNVGTRPSRGATSPGANTPDVTGANPFRRSAGPTGNGTTGNGTTGNGTTGNGTTGNGTTGIRRLNGSQKLR